jgi:hypothetical protein
MVILSAPNPATSDQTLWVVVGSVGLIALYLIMRPKKKKDPLSSVPSFSLTRQRDIEEQMSNLLVELSEMARQISAQLDTRAGKLEVLLKEADEKIAELRSARTAANIPATIPAAPPAAGPPALDVPAPVVPTAPPPEPQRAPSVDPRHAEVYRLSDTGQSAAEIAKSLFRPTGEIELILALRPRSS